MLYRTSTGIETSDPVSIDIEAKNPEASPAEAQRKRNTDMAETDYADNRFFDANFSRSDEFLLRE